MQLVLYNNYSDANNAIDVSIKYIIRTMEHLLGKFIITIIITIIIIIIIITIIIIIIIIIIISERLFLRPLFLVSVRWNVARLNATAVACNYRKRERRGFAPSCETRVPGE